MSGQGVTAIHVFVAVRHVFVRRPRICTDCNLKNVLKKHEKRVKKACMFACNGREPARARKQASKQARACGNQEGTNSQLKRSPDELDGLCFLGDLTYQEPRDRLTQYIKAVECVQT